MNICQNCKNEFVIEQDDFSFYEKMKVPPPTFCPQCREVRRMIWRNERSLYRRTCESSGKIVISCFSQESGIHVYDRDVWWGDSWDAMAYGKEYGFQKPFFQQFRDLLADIPMPALFNAKTVNTEYGNHVGEQKNGYLVFASWQGENISYASKIMNSKDSMELLASGYCEFGYEIINSEKIYQSAWLENCENCSNSYFLYECRGCTNCFGCTNLRNKSYYFFNQPYSKEEYTEKLKEYDLKKHSDVMRAKEDFANLKKNSLRKYANIFNSPNSTGDNLANASNCRNCYDIRESRDCKFCNNGGVVMNDAYDGYGIGAKAELLYESVDAGDSGQRLLADIFVWGGHTVSYSYACHGCQNIFGCIGLRQKQYCILNRQYSKEEYEALIPKIIDQMNAIPFQDSRGVSYGYGEFFPEELSPFAYNETIAQENYTLTRDEAIKKGYRWKDEERREYSVTLPASALPDILGESLQDLPQQVIGCAHEGKCQDQCTVAFKTTPSELQFYQRFNLPVPRLCSNCRHYERLRQRNPMRLWSRSCQCAGKNSQDGKHKSSTAHFHGESQCPNQFETTYAPERPETVYCEQCYNSEVS